MTDLSSCYALLHQRISERVGDQYTLAQVKEAWVLELSDEFAGEGYRCASAGGKLHLTARGLSGLLAGMGHLLRTSRYAEGVFQPSPWRGASTPDKPYRSLYFATHFHNFYHDAPLAVVSRYIEDLALLGYNSLVVMFDMHHYAGFGEASAQAMIRRLRALLAAAKALGMGTGLTLLANEGYAGSPPELRAEPTGRSHYGVELCPAKPGAMALLLAWRREVFAAFADLGLDQVILWPYDQGGCGCAACSPWGAKGFLAVGEAVAACAKEFFPTATITLSTWLFDHGKQPAQGEWAGIDRAFATRPGWVDYLLADAHGEFPRHPLEHGAPGGLPLVNFPEISMYGMYPWGGFGANPLPGRFERIWHAVQGAVAGGMPYSEGLYDDLNKMLISRFYWDREATAESALREYIAYEFAPEVVDEVMAAIRILEANHGHSWLASAKVTWTLSPRFTPMPSREGILYLPMEERSSAAEAWRLIESSDAKLPRRARASWRWRILYLRARIDRDLRRTGGLPTEATESAMEELTGIYHAEKAEYKCAPPTRASIAAARSSAVV